jgi:hypothetical protein
LVYFCRAAEYGRPHSQHPGEGQVCTVIAYMFINTTMFAAELTCSPARLTCSRLSSHAHRQD